MFQKPGFRDRDEIWTNAIRYNANFLGTRDITLDGKKTGTFIFESAGGLCKMGY